MKKIALLLVVMLAAAVRSYANEAPHLETKNKSSFKMEGNTRNPFWPIGWKPTAKLSESGTDHAGPEIPVTAFVLSSITLELEGRFAIININPDTPKFASNNRAQGTPEENKAAVLGSIALYGAYAVADKVITFKVEGSTYPNWTSSEQKRNISAFTPDQFTWTLAASVGGTAEVTWKRVK